HVAHVADGQGDLVVEVADNPPPGGVDLGTAGARGDLAGARSAPGPAARWGGPRRVWGGRRGGGGRVGEGGGWGRGYRGWWSGIREALGKRSSSPLPQGAEEVLHGNRYDGSRRAARGSFPRAGDQRAAAPERLGPHRPLRPQPG